MAYMVRPQLDLLCIVDQPILVLPGAGSAGDPGDRGTAVAARPAPRQRHHPQGMH